MAIMNENTQCFETRDGLKAVESAESKRLYEARQAAVLSGCAAEPAKFSRGWRAAKGPHPANQSGFRATGHRLLLKSIAVEAVSEGGILLPQKTVDKERIANTLAIVVEIGHDCWSDKSTDFCEVGDKVLVGQYTGKFEVSEADGEEYRFVTDLDIITTVGA